MNRNAPRPPLSHVGGKLLVLTVLALVLGGCALIPQFGHPDPTAGTIDTLGQDTLRVEIPDPDTWPIVEETKYVPVTPPPTTPAPKTPAPVTEEKIPDTITESETELPKVTPPAITVSPPKAELEELESEVIANIDEATQLVQGIDRAGLPTAGQDKLGTIHSMIEQARDALRKQDIQAAAGLARKARLLAVELTSS